MSGIIIFALIIINVPIFKFIYKLSFINNDDFKKSVKYSFTPDIVSLFRGEYWKDRFGEAKIGFFIFTCVLVVILEVFILQGIITTFI
ncbi:hypothetical protein KQI42_11860 [Tissierella sp. MSJ-40]|uniref:Uncharacterized protein n=1 Tax=Tissierella simiarum TaxID=2841534 RepID=A0ABS6E725_9FIRM|nr:hypothetical protein [Tissierella simiarum]MBU5438712.1 hypothetical protein [Tissierella simiarum]